MAIANYMVAFTPLEQIWFVVSPHNPLKEKKSLLNEHHRLALVEEAIGDDPRFKATDIEFNLPQPSYTVNTLAYLTEKYPGKAFALLMGADNLQQLPKWKNHEQLLANHKIYVYPRLNEVNQPIGGVSNASNVELIPAPIIEVSSTFIRKAIKEKKDVRHFMPEKVAAYIEKSGYYKS